MTGAWRIGDAAQDEVARIAAFIALAVRPGDLIALSGDLGAGKTTFARALIAAIAGNAHEEIPSPTFALAQTYETARFAVTHIDCYRLAGPEETVEIGLDEAQEHGVAIVEWPERIEEALPGDRLHVHFADGASEETRNVALTSHGVWKPRLQRLEAMVAFCDRAGWQRARVAYLQGDASARSYARIACGERKAILMDSPAMPDGPPVRDGKAYSAIAHLAENVAPFVAIAGALRATGLSAPEIFAHDLENGFLIIEDMGDGVFGEAIAAGVSEKELYGTAVDVLVALRQDPPPAALPLAGGGSCALPPYDTEALAIEVELLLDWFWPALKGEAAADAARQGFLALWRPLFDHLGEDPVGWVLRDYHSPNLIWLPDRDGASRVGIIDFQDALRGSAAYDLVSLAQDARRDVPEALEAALLGHYCEQVGVADPSFDRDRFATSYAILGAQRNTKILGIFARLAIRDGKRRYLRHIPRISAYLDRNLAHPALAGLHGWYERNLPTAERADGIAV